ncbi:MAG TPA: TonB-dependent receptor [Bacteroidota bacterium]|nr:TonB-dependent receptor [Bacteroidota bacterium]
MHHKEPFCPVRTSLKALRFIIPFVAFLTPVLAQEIPIPDSIKAKIDSIQADAKRRFIPSIGNIGTPIDTLSPFHSREFIFSDAQYAGDILWKTPGTFLREFGEPGQPSQLSRIGVDTRGIAIALDGRPLNDPVTGTFNLYDIPIEYVNEIEMFDGSAALFQTSNSPGGAINFVSHQYNNTRPLTKLRFFQGAYNHILSDGIFSQNVARGVNATFGYQRHVTDGRFGNAAYDSWNFRVRVRYNPSESLNLWIGDVYSKSTIGLNGGVDPAQSVSLYDEVTAVVVDQATYQIVSRHDLTAGVIGRFLPDSTALSKITAYYTSINHEYSNGNPNGGPPLFSDFQLSSFGGLKIQQLVQLPVGGVDLGGVFESRHVGQDHYLENRTEHYASGNTTVRLNAGTSVMGAFTGRYESLRGQGGLSWGVHLSFTPSSWLEVSGDDSRSYRFPTMQELFWKDSLLVRGNNLTKELHSLQEVSIRIKSSVADVGLTAFHKNVDNPIVLMPWTSIGSNGMAFLRGSALEYSGGIADVRLHASVFELAGSLTFTNSSASGGNPPDVPKIISFSELAYRNQFASGELDLKGAVRLKAVTHHRGLQFIPRLGLFGEQTDSEMPAFTTLDFYTVARIGDAYLTFEWENPLNVNTMVIPFYPLMDRNIKLGVNWFFTD